MDGELLSDEEDDNQAVEEVPEKISVTEQLRRQMKQKRGRGVQENNISEFERECQSYEMIPETNSKVDQLMWWRDHKEQLPDSPSLSGAFSPSLLHPARVRGVFPLLETLSHLRGAI